MKALSLLLILSLLLFGCFQPSPPKTSSGEFYEIVLENTTHSIEYFVTSSGYIQMKVRLDLSDLQKTKIYISKSPESAVAAQLALIRNDMIQNDETDCIDCSQYVLFYSNGSITRRLSVREDKASGFVKGIYGKAAQLFQSADRQETFFIQLVYTKKGITMDYHIFADGTIVRSEFLGGASELQGTRIYSIDKAKLEGILTGDFFDSDATDGYCSRFDYGYIEGAYKEKYAFISTCGDGKTAADALYNKVMKLVEE